MALPNTSKLIYGAIGTGVLGGAGLGTYYHLSSSEESSEKTVIINNVEKKLQEIGYLVLSSNSEDRLWDTVLEEYNKIQTQEEIFADSTLTKETKNGLKEKCRLALEIDPSNETNYKLAKRWCVKIENIQEMLTRNKYTKLGESSEITNKPKWEEKVSKIKAIEQTQRNIDVQFKNNNEDVGLLEAKCKSLNVDSIKTHSSENFEQHYIQVRDWCATKNDS
ncbi:hypothetical protein A6V39_00860 [Candidatus Mycoplasma haematobovis]|uniref:Uncharacterized protein n=1 Tax=Candidatus Mycoplasma haematobovis TaxID=432608 RepID=A0A1A9QDD4_9MOLU|nr:hypothetical protein [Candidatus Mycoplasma haematobovis]OAL10602.1 hypothetical protein A6V39_00860 [Candidatus Mycoplasma haematobovis]